MEKPSERDTLEVELILVEPEPEISELMEPEVNSRPLTEELEIPEAEEIPLETISLLPEEIEIEF